MKKTIKILKKKTKNKIVLQDFHFRIYLSLLSSCSRIILITSGLWLSQESPLRAMEDYLNSALHTPANPRRIDKDVEYSHAQEFHISERLKIIQPDIKKIKEEIINYKINLIDISEENFNRFTKIFKCLNPTTIESIQGLSFIQLEELFSKPEHQQNLKTGYSGAKVKILPRGNTKIVIKRFDDIKSGLKELLGSLIALNIDPDNKKVKIYDAFICPENRFHIIMEAAETCDIHDFLSTIHSENAVKACAEYLAAFHIKNHYKWNEPTNRKKFIDYAAYYSNTLSHDSIEEQTGPALFSLIAREKRTDLEDVKSNNIIQLLSREDQGRFISLLKITHAHFKENSSEIFRLIDPKKVDKSISYFLTINHGDAHGCNFFYNESPDLATLDGSTIKEDSLHRITMIDYASIVETYGDIGDPSGDIGRFLGSLWDWAAQQDCETYEKIFALQDLFLDTYLHKITESPIFKQKNPKIFEKMFKENCNFYKLRFYRAIFNSGKDRKSDEVKLKILNSWIKENADLEKENPVLDSPAQKKIIKKQSEARLWQAVEGKIIHNLSADPIDGFIESTAEGSDKTYLTQLWEELHRTGTATLSSTAAIAGMGGIGKTSLALEYAYEAFENKAYNLIYWLPSGTKPSLLKGYRELLREIGVNIQVADNKSVIDLVKQYLPKQGRCLLIYDNVPDPEFLKNKTPENAHILITTRRNEGWEENWGNPIILNVFQLKDSIEYFFKITKLERSVENAKIAGELAEELQHLPLALAHAAHYIKLVGGKNVSGQTFDQYLKDFRQESVAHFEEFRNSLTEAQSKITYENLIGKTLRMTEAFIAKLQKKPISELAKKLMGYCSYLDSDAIAEEFFLGFCENESELNETLKLLSSLSLIKRVKKESLFSMHRLLQLVVRNENESKDTPQSQEKFSHIVAVFNALFKKNIYNEEQIDRLLNYSTHILSLLEHSERLKIFSDQVDQLEWIGKTLFLFAVENPETLLQNQENITNKQLQTLKNLQILFKNSEKYDDLPNHLKQVAKNSNPKIQFILSQIYYFGDLNVNKNTKKALGWCKKAADQRLAIAQYYLGMMYLEGQNYLEAFKYFSQAAEQKFPAALCNLGCIYLSGNACYGQKQSYKIALKYYKEAAQLGHRNAQFYLGVIAFTNDRFSKAVHWYTKAAELGHVNAQYHLGVMYLEEQNYLEAFKYFSQAAEQGSAEAQYYLADMYENAKGIGKDSETAFKWYMQSAKQGNVNAQHALQRIAILDQRIIESHYKTVNQDGIILQNLSELIYRAQEADAEEQKNPASLEKAHTKNNTDKFKENLFYIIKHEGEHVPNALTVIEKDTRFDGYNLKEGQIIATNYKGEFDARCLFKFEKTSDGKYRPIHGKKTLQYSKNIKNMIVSLNESDSAWCIYPSYSKHDTYFIACDKGWRVNVSGAYDGHKWHWVTAETGDGGPWWRHRLFIIEAYHPTTFKEQQQLGALYQTDGNQKLAKKWLEKAEKVDFSQDHLLADPKVKTEKSATEVLQPKLKNSAPTGQSFAGKGKEAVGTATLSQSFVGKGKEIMETAPVKKHRNNTQEYLQEQLLLKSKVKIKGSAKNVVQQAPENNILIESIKYTSLANKYVEIAIQHADKENAALAEHCGEEAVKIYQLAEDAKLAEKLQEEESSDVTQRL